MGYKRDIPTLDDMVEESRIFGYGVFDFNVLPLLDGSTELKVVLKKLKEQTK